MAEKQNIQRMKRPIPTFDPSSGLLRNEHFQVSYATNDIERAKQVLSTRYGIAEFAQLQGQMPSGGHIHVEVAWVGNTFYELVTASGPGSEIFTSRLPQDEFAIRHHHLGFLIYDQPSWDALFQTIERDGWTLLSANKTEGFLAHCFVDAPELGHYLEFIFPEPAGLAFFESVPGT